MVVAGWLAVPARTGAAEPPKLVGESARTAHPHEHGRGVPQPDAARAQHGMNDRLPEASVEVPPFLDQQRSLVRRVVARYVVAVFCLWLAGHFTFGWWR